MSAPIPRAKLSILHLIIMMAAVGLALGFKENFPDAFASQIKHPGWKFGYGIFYMTISALAVGGMVVVVYEYIKTRWLIPHPGYILLSIAGISVVVHLISGLYLARMLKVINENQSTASSDPFTNFQYWQMAFTMFAGLVAIVGTFRDRWWWRVALVVFVLGMTVGGAVGVYRTYLFSNLNLLATNINGPEEMNRIQFLGNISFVCHFFPLLLLVVAPIADFWSKTRRDWIHWLGTITLVVYLSAPYLLFTIALRFVSPAELFGLP